MNKLILIGTIGLFTIIGNGCTSNEEPPLCTAEFRTVAVEVTGKVLENWRTIRLSTSDTFKLINKFENKYPIVDDNFTKTINNNQEDFQFQGIIADSVWVDETYTISADACHISYVSGKLNVQL